MKGLVNMNYRIIKSCSMNCRHVSTSRVDDQVYPNIYSARAQLKRLFKEYVKKSKKYPKVYKEPEWVSESCGIFGYNKMRDDGVQMRCTLWLSTNSLIF